MTDADTDPFGVPEADRVEQQTPSSPETDDDAGASTAPSVSEQGAAEADVLEQAGAIPIDEDDYPPEDPAR